MGGDERDPEVVVLLKQKSVREALETVVESFAGDSADVGCPDSGFYKELHAPTSIFEDHVVSQLERPQVITAEDLSALFAHHVLSFPNRVFAASYQIFQRSVIEAVNVERSSDPIKVYAYNPDFGFSLKDVADHKLWKRDGEMVLCLSGVLESGTRYWGAGRNWRETAYVVVEGRCTSHALDVACEEFKDVIATLLRSSHLIWELESSERLGEWVAKAMRTLPTGREAMQADQDQDNSQEPAASSCLPIVVELLNAHFRPPSKKKKPEDSIAGRIRNALHLLVQADAQSRHAVSVGLAVSSVETLLGAKGAGVVDDFGQKVATLLEPVSVQRENAITFAKALYDVRSGVFHGSQVDCPRQDRENARLLAAAVMKAYIERRMYFKHANNQQDESPDHLRKELKSDFIAGNEFRGVEPSPVAALWRKPNQRNLGSGAMHD